MTQCARPTQPRQAAPTVSSSNVWLDVEVLADRHEALVALSQLEDDPPEDEPQEEADEIEEEASDDLPF